MRNVMLLVVGILIGASLATIGAQSPRNLVGVNHIGMGVPNVDEALAYYTQKVGFREAFRNVNAQGVVTNIYLQINRDTYLELEPITAANTRGLNHFGLEFENLDAQVATYRQRGLMIRDPNTTGWTGMKLSNVIDPWGIRIDLAEVIPASLAGKARAGWK
ncbi:MAG: VOC family protein [Acidobacteria bacterium]|nr:VOC family protein [Acidobacteriota bacterium]